MKAYLLKYNLILDNSKKNYSTKLWIFKAKSSYGKDLNSN